MFKRKRIEPTIDLQSWKECRQWLKEEGYKLSLFDSQSNFGKAISIHAEKSVNGLTLNFRAEGDTDLETIQKLIDITERYRAGMIK